MSTVANTDVRQTVLVVDDEPDVAEAQAVKLRERYDTRVATSGREALEVIDEDVDAVVLDRRMPDVHGDEVLAEIRDRGYDCKVIMATAVDPDLNILEMEFDDYLCKPIFSDTLQQTLEQLLDPGPQDPRLSEFFSTVSKIEVLEEKLPKTELRNDEEYRRLKERARELGEELEESEADFEDLVDTFREISRG
jgi:CheY-like chemotaxis protein